MVALLARRYRQAERKEIKGANEHNRNVLKRNCCASQIGGWISSSGYQS
jgi:hypothetical protein